MLVVTDQTERKLTFTTIPRRIISIVPSQTELLYDLGLNQEIIAITKFCVHPQSWFRSKTRIGGTKSLDQQLIRSLQPDLLLANKEENEREQVEELMKVVPVYTSDIRNLNDAVGMISDIGQITGRVEQSSTLVQGIQSKFSLLPSYTTKLKAIYLIWQDPYMTVGGDSFISAMMELAGFENLFADTDRYPKIKIEEMIDLKPDIVLLSSEPYPFKKRHLEQLTQLLPNTKILLADGQLFSWYGSRLLKSAPYFMDLRKGLSK